MVELQSAIRRYLDADHPDLVSDVEACADAVADRWDAAFATDRERVVRPLRSELARRGLHARFPAVLAGTVRAAGYDLPATPVAAPPYVAVTSRGPVLRATVADGRLVVRLVVFDVECGTQVRYVRADGDPVAVAFHG